MRGSTLSGIAAAAALAAALLAAAPAAAGARPFEATEAERAMIERYMGAFSRGGGAPVPAPAAPPAQSSDGAAVLAVGGDRAVDVATGKAVMLSLPRDAAEVLVSDPAVADVVVKSPRRAYLLGKRQGDANAFFVDAAGQRVLTLDVHVDRDLEPLRKAIRALVPAAEVAVTSLNGHIVLSGSAPSSEAAENVRQLALRLAEKEGDVVSMVKTAAAEQVLIQVKVAEMRRSVAKNLGVSHSGQVSIGNLSQTFALGAAATGSQLVTGAFSKATATRSGAFGSFATSWEALETQGYVKTLAEPNLTARSGEEANFLAGGEFPVPTGRDSTGMITLEFKKFGVALKFQPVVLDGGRISMKIGTEVSALSQENAVEIGGIKVPGLSVRRAETAVDIQSGGGLVIGGLIKNDANLTAKGDLGLSELPILGPLFRSNEFAREETELVVVAVPYVVRPSSPDRIASPTDGFYPATTLETAFLARLYERHPGKRKEAAVKEPGVKSPVGFALE